MDMLAKETKLNKLYLLLLILLIGCTNQENKVLDTTLGRKYSTNLIGEKVYNKLYISIIDTINSWKLNGLQNFDANVGFYIDSTLCFSADKTRLISALLLQYRDQKANSDGIKILYGELIEEKWYFFLGMFFIIPRDLFKNQDVHAPLSYTQLHEQAFKNVLSGYLNINGEPNELWFTNQFEDIGWGDFNNQASSLEFLGVKEKFTDKRKFFEAIHLQSVKNNWYGVKKDSVKSLL